MTKVLRIGILGLDVAWLAVALACAMPRHPAESPAFEAEGVYVRHLRLRVTPSHTQAFEAMMKRMVEAAVTANLPEPYDWLCYRESPDRYWVLFFSDSATGFATPQTLLGIADHVGRAESETARNEIVTMVAELEYETEWEIVFQQKGSWSTVKEMSTSTHPKARIIERAIRPEKEPAFDAALSKWTAFLVNHRYPLPVEGFVLRSGATGTALQVVFPTDWSSYHGTDSFSAFTATLDARAQRQFADREAALMATVVSVEHYDGDFAPELSFQSR